ncbi:hypothetical protein [Streptomyces sp. NPDC058295]|uniref:hypothetical protein n=1 Tax=Streptomyces sp. NPDC058295 TaxID=3346431 RepID=UPI0036EC8E00
MYVQQFGWNTEFKALVARIVAEYEAGRSPATRQAGSPRVLLVTPAARGPGPGTRLVEECLLSARRIYEHFGFLLADEEPPHGLGPDLVSQNWILDLHDGLTEG